MVGDLPAAADPALLVGLAPFDDAAIYRIDDTTALVSTTDFFPPLVDDPADYGAIAAANACSDVFAMGGRVVLAINVAAFPEHFPRWAMAAIFDAAAAVVAEAGGTVAGGHTIRNPEPVFGLAVQGLVHPDRVFRKGGARPGDAVLLSKPLGTGLVLAGGDDDDKAAATAGMRRAQPGGVGGAAVARAGGARRHRRHRATASPATAGRSPSAAACGSSSTPPGSSPTRARWRRPSGACAPAATPATATTSPATSTRRASAAVEALCLDPQTSGGLLAAVDPAAAAELVGAGFWRVGTDRGRRAGGGPAMIERPRPGPVGGRRPTAAGRSSRRSGRRRARSSGSCGTSATTSSSASTRSAGARGPGR